MSGDKNKIRFMNYITSPLSDDSIGILYSTNNVKFDRVNLYLDFVISLFNIVFDTYLGDDITSKKDQKNHFKWCWEKNVDNFKKEGIGFASNKLYNYFFDFIGEVYYPISKKEENQKAHSNILKLWSYIFDFNNIKSKSDMDTLIEVYKLFEDSLQVV